MVFHVIQQIGLGFRDKHKEVRQILSVINANNKIITLVHTDRIIWMNQKESKHDN